MTERSVYVLSAEAYGLSRPGFLSLDILDLPERAADRLV